MRASLAVAATCIAAILLSAFAPKWTRVQDLQTARSAHAVTATDRGIYVLGGTGPDGKPVLSVERFDGKAWTAETTLPGEGLNAPAAAAVGNAVYLIGGFGTTTNRPVTSVHRYDTATRTWRDAAPLPAPRGGHAVTVLNGRIHVIGGGNSVSTIDDHSVYDPKTNTWSEQARLPRPMGSPGGRFTQQQALLDRRSQRSAGLRGRARLRSGNGSMDAGAGAPYLARHRRSCGVARVDLPVRR